MIVLYCFIFICFFFFCAKERDESPIIPDNRATGEQRDAYRTPVRETEKCLVQLESVSSCGECAIHL